MNDKDNKLRKSKGQKLMDKLGYKYKNAWEEADEEVEKSAFSFCEGYKKYINKGKTERECVDVSVRILSENGFKSIKDIKSGGLNPGDRVYSVFKGKTIAAAVIGENPAEDGVNIIGAHIDSPRLDIRPNPLYEDTTLALFKTRYYGGIKTFHWVSIPLSLHGVIIKSNGEKIQVNIGEKQGDPLFTIADLLPHLGREQMAKKASEAVHGESLNIIAGHMPLKDDKASGRIKLNVLNILNKKYGIKEEDFISAELEAVPAFKACDIGFDRALVGAYGHDDRICAYPALMGIIDLKKVPNRTAICYLSDKEETGSAGNTGAQSEFIANFTAELINMTNNSYSELKLRRCLANSKALSADVNAAVDPNYKDLQEKNNSTYLGNGFYIEKYTGGSGKGGANDANAEYIGELRKLLNDNNIIWQQGELGKMGKGGGGTIAKFMANTGCDVIDCGTTILAMHSTLEIASKIDIYMTYLAFKAFYGI